MCNELSEFAPAVRQSSLKRLRQVPMGAENWRVDPEAMSFADVAQHLIDADNWLFRKLEIRDLEPMVGMAHVVDISRRADYGAILEHLEIVGQQRSALLQTLNQDALQERITDARFGGEVTVWWVIVRGNLDHEIHHCGQIVAYLRAFNAELSRR
jgi:uncharacterized damage-inducible protein DinB